MFGRLITVVDNLVEAQAGANERIDRLAESHLLMAEAQRRADERMAALILVVNGLIRRDREKPQ